MIKILPLVLLLLLFSCKTAPTPQGIAVLLDYCLMDLKDWPVSVRCSCISDAKRRCFEAGYKENCAWDGVIDKDHDNFTINACKDRP